MEIVIFILLAACAILLISSSVKKKKYSKELKNTNDKFNKIISLLNEDLSKQSNLLQDQETKIKTLEKYQAIVDVEAFANDLKEQANKDFENVLKQIEIDKAHAQSKADNIIQEAKSKVRQDKEKAFESILDARAQAKSIIKIAEEKALIIAGEALEAKRNAEHFADTEKAMRNIIKGYGDEYLKPTHSLLDDLAEEFSYKDAGLELKRARKRTQIIINDSSAAKCDYVEQYRKTTAINFVLDAFNGKVDSILARVKHDNYGKLEQEIKDAFRIVNNNGKAFRNAVITEEFLTARIDELHWATKVFLLRLEEKEEQKRIREAIREEEKARREYEKAIKEAEKEEKMLQKAMEQARKQFESASEQEKQKYEEQLKELQAKYEEAEQRNQRALSMAQQTKRGHVYVISNIGSFGEDVFKIGLTRRLEPLDRVKELGDASVPFSFDVHAMIHSEDAPALETALHKTFMENQLNKVNPRKEFFKLNLTEIKAEIEKQGIEAKWTMKAEATEYRESLSISKQLIPEAN